MAKHRSAEEIATEVDAHMDALVGNVVEKPSMSAGQTVPAVTKFVPPLPRPEAFRRIQNTLKRLASDEDRRKVLSSLVMLHEEVG
jgi:hypothetical protein